MVSAERVLTRFAASQVEAKIVPINEKWVDKMREDFLVLIKNLPRVVDFETATTLRGLFIKYREQFYDFFFNKFLNPDREDGRRFQGLVDPAWSFYSELSFPLDNPTEYRTEEARYAEFEQVRKAWEQRLRSKAQKFWKSVRDYIGYTQEKEIGVKVPNVDRLVLEGFQVEILGYDPEEGSWQNEALSKFKEGLRIYRKRAAQIVPWVLKKQLPLKLDFNGKLKDGGRYEGSHVWISLMGIVNEPPEWGAHVLAHEMGHHWFKSLSGSAKKFWDAAISNDYGKLDLVKLLDQWPDTLRYTHSFFFHMQDRDPILALQVDTLNRDENMNERQDFVEALGKGRELFVPKNPITGYAGKNAEEAFCEAIGRLVGYGPATVLPVIKHWLNIVIPGEVRLASVVTSAVVPNKIFTEGKANLKALLSRNFSRPSSIADAIEDSVIPLHRNFVFEISSLDIHRHARRMLEERLEMRVGIFKKLAQSYQQLDSTLRNINYPLKTAEDNVRYHVLSNVLDEVIQEKLPTLGHALKTQIHLDPAKVDAFIRKVMKKATPRELEALANNAQGSDSQEDFRISSRFLDANAPKEVVSRLLKKEKITIDFLGWFDSIQRLLDVNYSQKGLQGFDVFNIGNLKAIVLDKNIDVYDSDAYSKYLIDARALLRNKGFEKLWYGVIFINSKDYKQLSEEAQKAYADLGYKNIENVAGVYHSGEDIVKITAPPNLKLVRYVVHEMGHRYWFKFMNPEQRARFNGMVKTNPSKAVRDFPSGDKDEDGFEKPVAPVSDYGASSIEEAFAEVFERYVMNIDLARDQLESFKKVITKSAAERVLNRFRLRTALNLDIELPRYWFENEKGERIIPDPETLDLLYPLPKDFKYQCHQDPLVLRTSVVELINQEDVDACNHPETRTDHGLVDGLEGRICNHCGGTQIKNVGEPWPERWEGKGTRDFISTNNSYSEDLVLAMTRPSEKEIQTALDRGHTIKPMPLSRAIILAANSCERCMNVLYYRHGLDDGYEEFSEDWTRSNTRCKLCEVSPETRVAQRFTAATVTRHIGFCGFCENTQKLRNGKLVLHGYQRPGWGYAEGKCPGVGKDPYEVSAVTAEMGLKWTTEAIASIGADRTKLKANPLEFEVEHNKDIVKIRDLVEKSTQRPGSRSPEEVLANIVADVDRRLERDLPQLKVNKARYEKLIRDWKPVTLTTVEELKAQQQGIKDEKAQQQRVLKEGKFEKIKGLLLKRIPKAYAALKAAEAEYRRLLGRPMVHMDARNVQQPFEEAYDLVWNALWKISELKMQDDSGRVVDFHDLCERLGIDDILTHLGFKVNGHYELPRQRIGQRNPIKDPNTWRPDWPGFHQ